VIPILSEQQGSPFPDPGQALDYPNGLLAAGGDLSVTRLTNAYRHGIFPWYSEGQPMLWWSPAPRCIIYPGQIHISRRLKRYFNQGQYHVTADAAFQRVILACAAPRPDGPGTWITPQMQDAFIKLAHRGIAHSVEAWHENRLIGGLYGIAMGNIFFGESMFSRMANGSKIALVALCQQLQAWQFQLLDCQVSNPHLISMGATEIPRETFQSCLKGTAHEPCWRTGFSCAARW